MFRKKLLLISFCLLVFYCCERDFAITFLESNISAENNTVVEINIPVANGNKVIEDPINEAIENMVISALHIGGPEAVNSKSVKESIERFNNEYNSFNFNFPDSPQIWEAQIDGDLMYQSPKIISIAMTSYINTGSANGSLTISFLNFDAETGEKIPNKHLFKNIKVFKKIANTYFEKTTKSQDVLFDSGIFELPENIGYTDEGIILLFNPYEIGSFATEITEFTIPFSEVDSVLNFNGF